jgi:hypothetical protein
MKITVTISIFKNFINGSGRAKQFSDSGLSALYYHLCDIDRENEDEIELDINEICANYSEYKNIIEAVNSHHAFAYIVKSNFNKKQIEETAYKFLNDFITYIPFEGGIIIKN